MDLRQTGVSTLVSVYQAWQQLLQGPALYKPVVRSAAPGHATRYA